MTHLNALDSYFNEQGLHSYLLDGDVLRHGLCADLGLSLADRLENVRRAGQLARLFHEAGVITVVALISPHRAARDEVRALFSVCDLSETHTHCHVSVCAARDPKGGIFMLPVWENTRH